MELNRPTAVFPAAPGRPTTQPARSRASRRQLLATALALFAPTAKASSRARRFFRQPQQPTGNPRPQAGTAAAGSRQRRQWQHREASGRRTQAQRRSEPGACPTHRTICHRAITHAHGIAPRHDTLALLTPHPLVVPQTPAARRPRAADAPRSRPDELSDEEFDPDEVSTHAQPPLLSSPLLPLTPLHARRRPPFERTLPRRTRRTTRMTMRRKLQECFP